METNWIEFMVKRSLDIAILIAAVIAVKIAIKDWKNIFSDWS